VTSLEYVIIRKWDEPLHAFHKNMAEKHTLDGTETIEETGSDQKRIKLEDQLQTPNKGSGDPHNTPASRVVHARAVPDGCTHQTMIAHLQKFGKIS